MGNIKINIKIVIIFLEERNGLICSRQKRSTFREERYEREFLVVENEKKREKKRLQWPQIFH